MSGNKCYAAWVVAIALVTGAARADTVFLTNGVEINGTIVHQDEQTVVVKTANGKTRSIRKADVDTIIREKVKPKEEVAAPVQPPATAPLTPAAIKTESIPVKIDLPKTELPAKTDGARTPPPRTDAAKIDGKPEIIRPDIIKQETEKTLPPIEIGGATPPAASDTPKGADAANGAAPIAGFPENTKRMSRRKEALLADAVAAIKAAPKSGEDTTKEAAIADIQALGVEVLPYLWAGVQSDDAEMRIASMRLLGQMNARNSVKRTIETFYMTMPEASAAATWNVRFIRAIKTTLPTLTGQTYITVEANRVGVQDGLKKYIEWYNANYERLPKQIGEPDLDVTDPQYAKKLKEARQLKLTKREWPVPTNLPVDLVRGPATQTPDKGPAPIVRFDERPADKNFAKSVPTITREDALKRPGVDNPDAPIRTDALKRDSDKRNEEAQKANSGNAVNRRDPVPPPSEIDPKTKKASPLDRNVDKRNAE